MRAYHHFTMAPFEEFNPSANRGYAFKNKTGMKSGRLTVISYFGPPTLKKYGHRWLCQCECKRVIVLSNGFLINSKGCGCQRGKHDNYARKHSMSNTSEWGSYRNAKRRCEEPSNISFAWYGGRGIEFRFKSFEEFFAELGHKPTPTHSVDRINPYGHYEVGNVRWATAKEQANNRRTARREK
jgi:hypothetical protein